MKDIFSKCKQPQCMKNAIYLRKKNLKGVFSCDIFFFNSSSLIIYKIKRIIIRF